MSIFRYPGSKTKLIAAIMRHFPTSHQFPLWSSLDCLEYREPFFGAGVFGLWLMENVLHSRCPIWINDIDPGMAAAWKAVHESPFELIRHIQAFTPSVEAFYEFKKSDGQSCGSDAEDGFRKIALHRMSVSGFGAMSGGPIGGRTQLSSGYTVDCRWTPSRIKRDIIQVHRVMKRFRSLRITCEDFREMTETAHDRCFLYLDPPYYKKGSQLYKFNMSPNDHDSLSETLAKSPAQWVLSYDDHSEIRRLYSWATFHEMYVTYSNAVCRESKRPKNREVVIVPISEAA